MAISNHWVISEKLEIALEGRSDVPDEVWLVDAALSVFWIAICLRRDGARFPYDDAPVRHWEFNSSELSS
jgi:hypothetical protein